MFYAGLEPRGSIALPGKYTIKLGYGGQSQSVPLTIAADPRAKGPLTSLRQKFALSMEVYHDLDALHRGEDIRTLKGEVTASVKKAAGKPNGGVLAAEGVVLTRQSDVARI